MFAVSVVLNIVVIKTKILSKKRIKKTRESSRDVCQLSNNLIREIFSYVHEDLRFIITRNGLGNGHELIPTKLSIHAILSARMMDYFKKVLLSSSFRYEVWPIVVGNNAYKDIVVWLKANRCPCIYAVSYTHLTLPTMYSV